MSHRPTSRRDFLKCSALLGAAAAVVPITTQMVSAQEATLPTTSSDAIDTYTVNMKNVKAGPVPPREITIPEVDGFKVLKGDFHMHTLFSDGRVMPADRVAEAVDNGLDVISITDHIEYRPFFSLKGRWQINDKQANDFNLWYDIAKPEADKKKLLLVCGTEITKSTMPPGHFNALFADDNNPIAAAVDDWRKMLQVAVDHGAFLLWNHPGWQAPKSGGIEPGATLRFSKEHDEVHQKGLMHGIEIFNGSEYYPVVSNWCNERDLALFANSDIHPSEMHQYGRHNTQRPITLVLAKERTVESVKEAFFAKRTVAWAGGMLWGRDPWMPALFKACVEVKALTPGTLQLTNKSSLPITVNAGGVAFELQKDTARSVYRASGVETLTVTNWMVAMNKPLEVAIEV